MTVSSREQLFHETAFIGYYFHWPEEQILQMTNLDRRRYCEEINHINKQINGEKNPFRI